MVLLLVSSVGSSVFLLVESVHGNAGAVIVALVVAMVMMMSVAMTVMIIV